MRFPAPPAPTSRSSWASTDHRAHATNAPGSGRGGERRPSGSWWCSRCSGSWSTAGIDVALGLGAVGDDPGRAGHGGDRRGRPGSGGPSAGRSRSRRLGSGRGALAMVGFGVTYAVASLTCALPLFLAAVAGSFGRLGVLQRRRHLRRLRARDGPVPHGGRGDRGHAGVRSAAPARCLHPLGAAGGRCSPGLVGAYLTFYWVVLPGRPDRVPAPDRARRARPDRRSATGSAARPR